MLAIDWTPEELRALEDEARESGRSPVDIVRSAVLDWLEDQHDLREAKEVMAEVRAGRMKTYSTEEVRARLGLATGDR